MNEDWLPQSQPAAQPEEEPVVGTQEPRMDIETLLEELLDLAERGHRFPWRLFGRSIVNVDDLYDLVHKIDASLPTDVKTAEHVISQRERILREAHEEKAKIINAAKEQAAVLVSNDEITQQARRRADEIIQQAQIEAEGIRGEADAYAREAYRRLEDYTSRILIVIQKTRRDYDQQAATRPREPEAESAGKGEPTPGDEPEAPMPGEED
jgi:hypothetical protein